MSLLSDEEITKRCQLPEHLKSFQNFLRKYSPISSADMSTVDAALAQHSVFNANEIIKVLPHWALVHRASFVADLSNYTSQYGEKPMIEPFVPHLVRTTDDEATKLISYGLSSYGYDARLTEEVKTFTNINGGVIDPKRFDSTLCVDTQIFTDTDGSRYVIIPPNGFILGTTVEYFRIPRDVSVICMGKSTIARCGLTTLVTPLEAGWEGNVTIEVANTTPLPVRVYLNEGICQFMFMHSQYKCKTSYADGNRKYQKQIGLTLPRV